MREPSESTPSGVDTCSTIGQRKRSLQGEADKGGNTMVVLGLILLIVGLVAKISILTTIGAILLVVGLILNFVPIGGTSRRVF
ncbi:hypothetical protein [Nocardioides sp. CF8]|uniref:hypothetical protein n=1 Tax=Nocardioides sp. CF8 TaxID=110319 RepID=UPI0018DE897F|nr:hypothetical protein [Nocardioides sp. CF8]